MSIATVIGPSYIMVALCPCDQHKIELKDLPAALARYMATYASAFALGPDPCAFRIQLFVQDETGTIVPWTKP
jgi:hypothetical protein